MAEKTPTTDKLDKYIDAFLGNYMRNSERQEYRELGDFVLRDFFTKKCGFQEDEMDWFDIAVSQGNIKSVAEVYAQKYAGARAETNLADYLAHVRKYDIELPDKFNEFVAPYLKVDIKNIEAKAKDKKKADKNAEKVLAGLGIITKTMLEILASKKHIDILRESGKAGLEKLVESR